MKLSNFLLASSPLLGSYIIYSFLEIFSLVDEKRNSIVILIFQFSEFLLKLVFLSFQGSISLSHLSVYLVTGLKFTDTNLELSGLSVRSL